MYRVQKTVHSRWFAIVGIFLLLFSLFSPMQQFNLVSAEGNNVEDGPYGSIQNDSGQKEFDRATINKEVAFGEKPGEYFIDLTIKGKERYTQTTTDVVIVYDNSNSMEKNNRVGIAKQATEKLVDDIVATDGFRMALVTYGSSVFDGRKRTWGSYQGTTLDWSHKPFTTNANNIKAKIPHNVPENRTDGGSKDISTWHGGTFTQQGLEEARTILDGSNADNKIVILLTDGVTTYSYGSGKSVEGSGSEYEVEHGNRTIAESQTLTNKGYEVFTIGIEIGAETGITKSAAEQLVKGMASKPENAYLISNVNELDDFLRYFGRELVSSVSGGKVEDPIGEQFILQGASSFTAASNANLTDGAYFLSGDGASDITVTTDGQTIILDGLNLKVNEEVRLRYKVQIDTEKAGFEIDTLYRTNGKTTLTPDKDEPATKYTFPEPRASAKGISITGEKEWVDFGLEKYRPNSIKIDLMNGDTVVKTVDVNPDGNGKWLFDFENVIMYDKHGNMIDYTFQEHEVDGYLEPIYEERKITNILDNKPEITLNKTAVSTSVLGDNVLEAGKKINYTFKITNDGNLDLHDIVLTDQLQGMSDFTFNTLNGEPFTDNINNLVLKPGDILVASATYTVTQADVDYGRVTNFAHVEGTPEGYNPNDPDSPQKVTDDDEALVPSVLEPSISLQKTADRNFVTSAGNEITYTFNVKNTGNTTLTDIILNDPMLGGQITLPHTVLLPGESTEVIVGGYTVTQADMNNGKIVNEATTEGTPPFAYTNNPDNPDKVSAKDDEEVKANQQSVIELVKVANKANLVTGDTITYTFTVTNRGNTTLTDIEITDTLDRMSEIEYLTINGSVINDLENLTLEPSDVLIARATYDVVQADVDNGKVYNIATVTGLDPNEEEVVDSDNVTVQTESQLSIALVKSSDKAYVTEVGQKIAYTFTVTNTSNVTLTDVIVIDPMLGDDIVVSPSKLEPGQVATGTAEYVVTEEDIAAGMIQNTATATGTPPNPTDDPPISAPAKDEVPVAKIQLDKSSLPNMFTKEGQEVMYTFVITNTGAVTLNNVTLTDSMLGGMVQKVDMLAPGEITTVQVPYIVTATDMEAKEILNTAIVEGTPEGYEPENDDTPGKVTDEDNDKVAYAGLSLEKTSNKDEVTEVGEEITYTFTVTNMGKVTLENIEVHDDMLTNLNVEIVLEQTTLEPGETTTGTATYHVTQTDLDVSGVYNVATATGEPPGYDPEDPAYPDEPPVSPPDEEFVPANQQPNIELMKTADTKQFAEVGQKVIYTFKVTNTGNVTLTDVYVDDVTFGFEVILDKTILEPGDSATGTYTHTITQEDMNNGFIDNEAVAEGMPPPIIDPLDPNNPVEQEPVKDEDDEDISALQLTDIVLEKVADKQQVDRVGEVITYTFTVTNNGNVTLTDVMVHDDMLGGKLAVSPSELGPGEQGTVTGTYKVTQEDIDHKDTIVNIATATGTPPGDDPEDPETPPVEEEVSVIHHPEIVLVKQADKEKLVAGETITYTFTATNVGNTTLHHVNLVDELNGLSEIVYESINGDGIVDVDNITLLPGDVLVAKASYVVTLADVEGNEVYNRAIVEGTPPPKENPEDPDHPIEQEPVIDEDDATVPSKHKPDILLEKFTHTQSVAKAGDTITYNFVITNTGNVTLDNIRVQDDILEKAGVDIHYEKTTLAPGEATTATAVYTVTQQDLDEHDQIINIATATGFPPKYDPEDPSTDPSDPGYPPVSPPDEAEVPVEKRSSIELVKEADIHEVTKAGEKLNYTFTVTNTGNLSLHDVNVYDETFNTAIVLEQDTLAPGETTTGTLAYVVSQADIDRGDIINTAIAEGTPANDNPDDPNSEKPTDRASEQVKAMYQPGIKLEKMSPVKKVRTVGQEVTYSFVVTNTGNVTLTDVSVSDNMLEDVGVVVQLNKTTLQPGEEARGTATYKVTEVDLKMLKLVNIATATGTPPGYDSDDPNKEKPTHTASHEIPTGDTPILPKTATNIFNILTVGLLILVGGTILQMIVRRRKRFEK